MGYERFSRSRRNFMTGKFVQDAWERLRSKGEYEGNYDGDHLRDTLIEWFGEGLTAMAILTTAYQGSMDPNVRPGISSRRWFSERADFGENRETMRRLSDIIAPIANGSNQLKDVWKKAYYHCHTEYYLDCDSSGEDDSCSLESEEKCAWDEPSQLTSRGVSSGSISRWDRIFSGNTERAQQAVRESAGAFDTEEGMEAIDFPEVAVGAPSQLAVAIPFYIGAVGLLVWYEEIAELISRKTEISIPIEADIGIKRRTFLKLATAVGLAAFARSQQLDFLRTNKLEAWERAKQKTQQILRDSDVPAEQTFARFFGISVGDLRAEIVDSQQSSEKVLASSYDGNTRIGEIVVNTDHEWKSSVNPTLAQYKNDVDVALVKFDNFFHQREVVDQESGRTTLEFTIPKELTRLMKAVGTTNELQAFVTKENLHVHTRHIVNAAVLAGLGTLAAVFIEGFIGVSNRVMEEKAPSY